MDDGAIRAACKRTGRMMIKRRSNQADECPICYSTMCGTSVLHTPCGHSFHVRCLRSWQRRQNDTCPMCREPLPGEHRWFEPAFSYPPFDESNLLMSYYLLLANASPQSPRRSPSPSIDTVL